LSKACDGRGILKIKVGCCCWNHQRARQKICSCQRDQKASANTRKSALNVSVSTFGFIKCEIAFSIARMKKIFGVRQGAPADFKK